jgi:hypothetical protein
MVREEKYNTTNVWFVKNNFKIKEENKNYLGKYFKTMFGKDKRSEI